ncbi:MAG: chemotaxis protein CheC [Limnochordia bacterium]|jgi:chemotaxis protein CheC
MTQVTVAPEMQALIMAGLHNAGQGLTQLLGVKVTLEVDRMALAPVLELDGLAWAPEADVTGIYIGYSGDLTGHCLLCLDGDNPDIFTSLFLGDTDDREMVDSALLEAGNIVVSWLINGIADRGGWKIAVTPPALARDMLGALVNTVLAVASAESEELLAVCVRFRTGESGLTGTIMLMPDAESLRVLSRGGGIQ